jgi:hypothetical protein
VEDLTDLPSLVAKLRGNDRLATHLLSRLSNDTRKLLSAYEGGTDSALKEALVKDLNAIIRGPLIYEAKRFSQVARSPKTQELLVRNPQGKELQRLNRLLLQDAYPGELSTRTRTATE